MPRLIVTASRVAGCAACGLLTLPVAGSASAATTLPAISPQPFAAASTSAVPPQSAPDDIAALGDNLFVTYQNGVGSTGTPAKNGVSQSTVVEYSPAGTVLQSWLLTGRCDGLGADPANNRVLATINEDANSQFAVLTPGVAAPTLYTYSPSPTSNGNGGTDSISIGPRGVIYVAHSNPDTTTPGTAATYTVTLSGTTATLTPLFAIDARATDAATGKPVTLALTDPDSNRYIPPGSPTLGGAFLQDSQGDGKLIIVNRPGGSAQTLQQLSLTNAEQPTLQPTIDDVAEVTGPGTLYVVDQGAGTVQAIDTSAFKPGTLVVSQPADSTTTPATAGQLGVLNPTTGVITHFATTFTSPKGLVFVPGGPVAATPEVPLPVVLPLGAVAVGAVAFGLNRRRSARA